MKTAIQRFVAFARPLNKDDALQTSIAMSKALTEINDMVSKYQEQGFYYVQDYFGDPLLEKPFRLDVSKIQKQRTELFCFVDTQNYSKYTVTEIHLHLIFEYVES